MNTNPEFWMKQAAVKSNMATWLAVHGNLCLALRHPENMGTSRQYVVDFTKKLGRFLVESRAMTQEELEKAERLEAEEGSLEFGT